MQKWGVFSMGIMAGIIVVLLSALLMQNREPQAYAATAPATQAADGGHEGLIMGIGASQQNQSDICWVLFKRAAPRKAAAGADPKDVVAQKDERITLAAYQIGNGARSMKLAAVRDISFDSRARRITPGTRPRPPQRRPWRGDGDCRARDTEESRCADCGALPLLPAHDAPDPPLRGKGG